MNGKYGLQKVNLNNVLETIKKSAPEKPISETEAPSDKLLNAIYLEVLKSYKMSGKTALTNKAEMMDMTRGITLEGFNDFNMELIDLIPDLFSIARKIVDIPTLKTIHKARSSSKWHYLTKTSKQLKEVFNDTKNESNLLDDSERKDFFKDLINKHTNKD
jgi:hypothetical protein